MQICCKLIAFGLAAIALSAARGGVPTEWQVRIGPKATVYQAERYHGDALDLRATLTSGGLPLVYQGSARLYAQTNGMGAQWWDLAPVTVSSNVLAATWRPEFDTGADVVDVFLGAPSNFQAHARIRFLPSPGPVPNALPLPAPVLDFAAVDLVNVAALTNGWSFGDSGGPYLSATGGVVSGTVKVEGTAGMSGVNGHAELGRDGVSIRRAGFPFSSTVQVRWPSAGNGTLARLEDIPPISASDATFSNAVLAVGIGIDTNTVAVINALVESEGGLPIGGATSVGGLLLALAAAVAALNKRLALKADAVDLRYRIVTPGFTAWTWADGEDHGQPVYYAEDPSTEEEQFDWHGAGWYLGDQYDVSAGADATSLSNFEFPVGEGEDAHLERITATRGYALLDRASNRVTPTGSSALTLTLPAAVPGYMRDLIVRLDLTALATAPEVTFAAPTGETVTFETEDGAMPELEPGKVNLVSFTETAPGVIDVAHKTMQEVA